MAKVTGTRRLEILRAAKEYASWGWIPIPVHRPGDVLPSGKPATGKEPFGKNWNRNKTANEGLAELRRRESNVGVLLGDVSTGLVDVDLDCPEALMLAPLWLPDTDFVFGRESAPQSHWLFQKVEGETLFNKTIKFVDPSNRKATLLEIRSTGQTVFPPSVHGTGEHVEWDLDLYNKEGSLGVADMVLLESCKRIAAGCLLARYWTEGSYHDATLALAGGLARAGWDEQDAQQFILPICHVVGMNNPDDRENVIKDTYRRYQDGENVVGWPTLSEYFPENIVLKVRDLLGIGQELAAQEGRVPLNQPLPMGVFPHTKQRANGEVSGLKLTYQNVDFLMNAYGYKLQLDEITGQFVYTSPTGSEGDSFFEEVTSLAKLCGLPTQGIVGQIRLLGFHNKRNPVVEYLDSLETPKDDTAFRMVADTLEFVDPAARKAKDISFRLFMVQNCAAADAGERSPNPEAISKYEHVFVIAGSQGLQKTLWFYELIPEPLKKYFKESVHLDPTNKDSVIKATEPWISELGEVDSVFRKVDVSRLKAFLSERTDTYRKPYAAETVTLARRTSFGASVNYPSFLNDTTGNRRFWVNAPDSIKRLLELPPGTIEDAWAWAWHQYLQGERWWPDMEEEELLQEGRAPYEETATSAISELLEEFWGTEFSLDKRNKTDRLTTRQVIKKTAVGLGLPFDDLKITNRTVDQAHAWLAKHNRRVKKGTEKRKKTGRRRTFEPDFVTENRVQKWRMPQVRALSNDE